MAQTDVLVDISFPAILMEPGPKQQTRGNMQIWVTVKHQGSLWPIIVEKAPCIDGISLTVPMWMKACFSFHHSSLPQRNQHCF